MTTTIPWPDRPMGARSLRVAMSGYVHDDDPTIIADMQQEIERLRAALTELLASCSYEGEVGLDASKRRIAAKNKAREALSSE